jgi:hypothetical protein
MQKFVWFILIVLSVLWFPWWLGFVVLHAHYSLYRNSFIFIGSVGCIDILLGTTQSDSWSIPLTLVAVALVVAYNLIQLLLREQSLRTAI